MDLRAGAGQEEGSLSRRVAAAHNHRWSAGAGLGLHLGRRVVHTHSLKFREALQREAIVARPRGNDDGPCADELAVVELDLVRVKPRR